MTIRILSARVAMVIVMVTAITIPVAAAPVLPPALAPSAPTDGLVAALAAADTTAYLQELDRLLYEDLVAGLGETERPVRPPLEPDRLRRSLAPTSALLAFLPDGDTVWAVAVTAGGFVARRLDTPQTPALGGRLQHWARDPTGQAYDAHAALLVHNNLFPPFRESLSGIRHVIVAPGGVLRGIPFETLLMASGEDLPAVERPYLMHRFEFSYEATLGSRLGWSSRPGELQRLRAAGDGSGRVPDQPIVDGTLVAVAGRPPGGAAVASLRWLREGAQGALLGGSEDGMDGFLRRYFRERAGGRRPAVRAVYRVRSALLREGAAIDAWAWPLLFGAE